MGQWDGTDNDAANLNPTGLGGIDLTDTGLADEFHAIIETDIDTSYTFTVLSQDGGECSRTVEIPGDDTPQDYFLGFSTFTQGCDFSDVGAIEILVEAFDNVDSIIYLFAVSGQPDPSPSPAPQSPSNSPAPSDSPSPSTIPPSSSPTPSPSTIPPAKCMCHCPAFTCESVFDPDDDENNAYYFDDDDDNPGRASGSGVATSDLTGSNLSSYYFSTSNAGVIQASALCVLAAAVALI